MIWLGLDQRKNFNLRTWHYPREIQNIRLLKYILFIIKNGKQFSN